MKLLNKLEMTGKQKKNTWSKVEKGVPKGRFAVLPCKGQGRHAMAETCQFFQL
jgi:hypothetical protein